MAASYARCAHVFRNIQSKIKRDGLLIRTIQQRCCSSITGNVPEDVLNSKADGFSGKSIEILQEPEVKTLLERMTGLNLSKIYSPRKEPLQKPVYKVMEKDEYEKVGVVWRSILSNLN